MNFSLECEQEVDGRWIAEVPELPGVLAYGGSSANAMAKLRFWLFASSLIDLKMGNSSQSASASHFHSLHEQ